MCHIVKLNEKKSYLKLDTLAANDVYNDKFTCHVHKLSRSYQAIFTHTICIIYIFALIIHLYQ